MIECSYYRYVIIDRFDFKLIYNNRNCNNCMSSKVQHLSFVYSFLQLSLRVLILTILYNFKNSIFTIENGWFLSNFKDIKS